MRMNLEAATRYSHSLPKPRHQHNDKPRLYQRIKAKTAVSLKFTTHKPQIKLFLSNNKQD